MLSKRQFIVNEDPKQLFTFTILYFLSPNRNFSSLISYNVVDDFFFAFSLTHKKISLALTSSSSIIRTISSKQTKLVMSTDSTTERGLHMVNIKK